MATVEPINNFETNSRRSSIAIRPDRRAVKHTKPVGRYDGRSHNTRMPGAGLGQAPSKSRDKDDVVVAAVIDPMGDGTERLYASVNSRVDILEWERSHGHISENAYRTGRLTQAIFERLGTVSGSNWCGASRMDPSLARELNVIRLIDSAARIQELMEQIRGRIGMIDTRLVRRVLGERLSYAECGALQGKGGGERGTSYIAKRFREALEDLAESWIAKGKATPTPVDKHAGAAGEAVKRQAVSIEKGVTAARVAAEAVELEK